MRDIVEKKSGYTGPWPEYTATMLVCVDSYQEALAKGRLYSFFLGEEKRFASLDQLLFSIEEVMDEVDEPDKKMELYAKIGENVRVTSENMQWGRLANYFIRISYRQNSSMQGFVSTAKERTPTAFRSGMELLRMLRRQLSSDEASEQEMKSSGQY